MAHASKCPPLPAGNVDFAKLEGAARKGDNALAKEIEAQAGAVPAEETSGLAQADETTSSNAAPDVGEVE